MKQMPALLTPWRNPVFVQFASHKAGRLLVPYFLIVLFASNLFLKGTAYGGILALQCAWYFLACTGGAAYKTAAFRSAGQIKSLVLFPHTFVLMNWAAVVGMSHFMCGQHDAWGGYDARSVVSVPGESQVGVNCAGSH
jgi:biofilm PGA synthesis N-glycosyltransferase PgaC